MTSAPDPLASTAIVWIGLLLVSFAITSTAIIVALYVWSARPERSDGTSTPMGYALALGAACLLAVATVVEIAATFFVPGSALETLAIGATVAQLPVAFGIFAFAIYRRRPPS